VRHGGYRLASVVSWPAAVWGCMELAIRGVTGYGEGWAETLLITICAFVTIFVSAIRGRTFSTG